MRIRIAPFLALCLLLSGCGELLEEAAEQALDQGGIDVDLDDVEDGDFTINFEGEDGEQATININGEEGTVDIETEDGEEGSISIDSEDGTVEIEADGELTTIEVDEEAGTVEIEGEGGEGSFNLGAGLPDDWPDEYPLPDDATILSSVGFEENGESGFNAVFTGPTGSLDRYLDHFRGLDLPIVSETESVAGESRQWTILWGTEDEPAGSLLVGDNGEEVFGQVTIGNI